MPANGRALSGHVDHVETRDGHDDMRHTAVDVVHNSFFAIDLEPHVHPQIGRFAHLQPDQFAAQVSPNDTGRGPEGNLLGRPGDLVRETREAAGAIPAHLGFTAVAVVIAHSKIGAVRPRFEQKNSVCPHPAMSVTNPRDLLRPQPDLAAAIVDHDEVVAGAVHFREAQLHRGKL